MEKREKNGWTSVPQFGAWDQKDPGATNYSVVFSQARANKKQQKTDIKHPGIGYQRVVIAPTTQDDSVLRKKKILTYINCCIKP
ncbi:hypothetical protein JCGZ_22727 [Jatropha curcas]|uniref:RIN4 pathogenic type III effector avirulence factor Avr cleavage site domain-containing protein n=1 Tax=Jatropha curcas TaxID=180498 RepID=A0A067LF91_JATCU|nr:uncharacterized protein LOC105628950 isoform X2 [Jatropha curcas]XP_037492099.1 uncharacterized protein LOC105628950 isoform X1 [Jatropha curcas]KDP43175.1 hypothetical protein JCGZ_22727 [Jatropha curcas]